MTDTPFDETDYRQFVEDLPRLAAGVMAAFDTGTDADLDAALDAVHDADPHHDQPHGLSTFAGFLMQCLAGYTADAAGQMGGSAANIGGMLIESLDHLLDSGLDLPADEVQGRRIATRMYAAALTDDDDGIQTALDLVDSADLLGTTLAACVELCSLVSRALQSYAQAYAAAGPDPHVNLN